MVRNALRLSGFHGEIQVVHPNHVSINRFELNELVFTLKSLKYPSPSFNITDYITFADGNTRSSSSGKIRNNNNADRHFFSIESLDCGMPYPPIDLSLSIKTNKTRVYKFLW